MGTTHSAHQSNTTDRQAAHLGAGTDDPPNIADLFPEWQRRAACAGLGAEAWFGRRLEGRNNHGFEAKKVCATCPVAAFCLDAALERSEEFGIWGGCGEAGRRAFMRIRPHRKHGPEPVNGCGCRWCVEWRRHWSTLRRMAAGGASVARANVNGKGATHARRSTYAKGCRCPSCTWAASPVGQLASRVGLSTADSWAHAEGEHGPAETARRLGVAVIELVVESVVALVALAGTDPGEALSDIEGWAWLDNGTPRRSTMTPWLAARAAPAAPVRVYRPAVLAEAA